MGALYFERAARRSVFGLSRSDNCSNLFLYEGKGIAARWSDGPAITANAGKTHRTFWESVREVLRQILFWIFQIYLPQILKIHNSESQIRKIYLVHDVGHTSWTQ